MIMLVYIYIKLIVTVINFTMVKQIKILKLDTKTTSLKFNLKKTNPHSNFVRHDFQNNHNIILKKIILYQY